MALSTKAFKPDEVVEMGYHIQEYLVRKNFTYVKPKDLMKLLINKGFFNYDHNDGEPLRKILGYLDDHDLLYLLPQVTIERKQIRYYFFDALSL